MQTGYYIKNIQKTYRPCQTKNRRTSVQAVDRMVALTCMPTLFFTFCIAILAADLTAQPAFSGQGDRAPDGQRIIYTTNEIGPRWEPGDLYQ